MTAKTKRKARSISQKTEPALPPSSDPLLGEGGVPWSEVMLMSENRRLACCVALGELAGQIFDWTSLGWSALDE